MLNYHDTLLPPNQNAFLRDLNRFPEFRKMTPGMRAEFERDRPGILGSLFDAVSESLKNLTRTVLTQKNVRMLDFAKFVIAAESALPFDRGFFMKSYRENADRAAAAAIENDDVADAIRTLMSDREMWESPARELLDKLTEIAGETAKLPKRPNQLSGKIRRSIPSLKKAGIQIDTRAMRWGEKKSQSTIFFISLIHNCKESIGNIGNASFCADEDNEKTDTYFVADGVADNPNVADKHRQPESDVADHRSCVADQESGVADAVFDIKHNKINGVADVADPNGIIRGSEKNSRCSECGNRDRVHSNYCLWNEGGLQISWEKCHGKSFRPLSDLR